MKHPFITFTILIVPFHRYWPV